MTPQLLRTTCSCVVLFSVGERITENWHLRLTLLFAIYLRSKMSKSRNDSLELISKQIWPLSWFVSCVNLTSLEPLRTIKL